MFVAEKKTMDIEDAVMVAGSVVEVLPDMSILISILIFVEESRL